MDREIELTAVPGISHQSVQDNAPDSSHMNADNPGAVNNSPDAPESHPTWLVKKKVKGLKKAGKNVIK